MYIGIDLGTTGLKGILCDGNGSVIASHYTEYPLILSGGYVEQDANVWWNALKDAVRSMSGQAKVSNVNAISVSAQGISFVPVDKRGSVLGNAVSWLDTRAKEELKDLEERFGAGVIYEKTGKPLNPAYTFSKLMWLRKNRFDVYNRAYKLLMPLDFINLMLCGRAVTDYTMASGTMAYNINSGEWDKELLDFAKIDIEKLPDVLPMGSVIGTICKESADAMGINRDALIVLGGQDQKLAAIGAGLDKKCCAVSFGTATAISKLQSGFSPSQSTCPYFKMNESEFIAEDSIGTTGAALKWVRETMFPHFSYAEMDEAASKSPKGANGVSFSPNFDKSAQIAGLTLASSEGDVIRALFEGICGEIKTKIDGMGGAERILVYGGGAKSDIWCKILAETAHAEVCRLGTLETAATGAVMLASQGIVQSAEIKERVF